MKRNWGIDYYGEDGEHNRMTAKSGGHEVACNLQRQRIGDTIGLVEAVAGLTEGWVVSRRLRRVTQRAMDFGVEKPKRDLWPLGCDSRWWNRY